ncbi:hypothetical protein J6590_029435 [Homalodisca vitripennis]|nr:hypothetical protein J6590_029435 [Homalodisca vitripennis]
MMHRLVTYGTVAVPPGREDRDTSVPVGGVERETSAWASYQGPPREAVVNIAHVYGAGNPFWRGNPTPDPLYSYTCIKCTVYTPPPPQLGATAHFSHLLYPIHDVIISGERTVLILDKRSFVLYPLREVTPYNQRNGFEFLRVSNITDLLTGGIVNSPESQVARVFNLFGFDDGRMILGCTKMMVFCQGSSRIERFCAAKCLRR